MSDSISQKMVRDLPPHISEDSIFDKPKLEGQDAAASMSGSMSAFSKCARAKPLRYDMAKLTF